MILDIRIVTVEAAREDYGVNVLAQEWNALLRQLRFNLNSKENL